MQTGKQDHYSAHEMIVELIDRQPDGWQQTAVAIFDSVAARYLVWDGLGDYVPVTLEWEGWEEATYASSLQFARTALLLYQALDGHPLQRPEFATWAQNMAAACSHGQNFRCVQPDGRMFTTVKDILFLFNIDSWYEQNFNTVKYYLELLCLDPSLAPSDENHMLWSSRAVRSITYPTTGSNLQYEVASGAGREVLKLAAAPLAVLAASEPLPEMETPDQIGPGYHWDAEASLLTVVHTADPVVVHFSPTAVIGNDQGGYWLEPQLEVIGAAGTEQAAIRLALPRAATVNLAVFDLRGRRVRTLLKAAYLAAGNSSLTWYGRDEVGRTVAQGVYVLQLEVENRTKTHNLVLLR